MGPMMKSGTRYRLMAASITSASQPWARKKAMNGPTTASKKPRHVQSGASRCFSSITTCALRFPRKQGGDDSNSHCRAVNTIRHTPAHGGCQDEDQGICSQERQAIAELISRREKALLISIVSGFNSPGVDDNVLCR